MNLVLNILGWSASVIIFILGLTSLFISPFLGFSFLVAALFVNPSGYKFLKNIITKHSTLKLSPYISSIISIFLIITGFTVYASTMSSVKKDEVKPEVLGSNESPSQEEINRAKLAQEEEIKARVDAEVKTRLEQEKQKAEEQKKIDQEQLAKKEALKAADEKQKADEAAKLAAVNSNSKSVNTTQTSNASTNNSSSSSSSVAPAKTTQSGYIDGTCKFLLDTYGIGNFTPGDSNYTSARDRDKDGVACEK
jgi:Excalibur calcium-binding domain